jgi:hypothetical protein
VARNFSYIPALSNPPKSTKCTLKFIQFQRVQQIYEYSE